MTEPTKNGGGTPEGTQSGRPEGERRRGERRGRGRRRRGGSRPQEPAGAAGPQRQPSPPREEQPPAASLVAFLARAGRGSRRRCDEMIQTGRVTVNGEAVDFPRLKLAPDDVVAVDGETVEARALRYVLLNKPRGVASTRSDPHAERVIVDLVPDGRVLFPVGRLDVDTTGLIILTNDGPLAHRLMHPSYGVPKTYVARIRGRVGKRELAELRSGVELEDGLTAPADARLLKQGGKTVLVELTIHQGRKRQVRRMFAALGLQLEELQRSRYGPLADTGLAAGQWRELSLEEIDALRRAAEHVEICVGGEPVEEAVTLAAAEKAPEKPEALEDEPGAEDAGGLEAETPMRAAEPDVEERDDGAGPEALADAAELPDAADESADEAEELADSAVAAEVEVPAEADAALEESAAEGTPPEAETTGDVASEEPAAAEEPPALP
jgi:23S rRNA pseudouridine2605 synthase